jgi:hypothetical protein
MNCAVGVYMAGAGYFLWWTLRLAGSYALFHSSNLWRGAAANTASLVRARGPKAVPIAAGRQPGTASDDSEVFWPNPRIPAFEGDIPAVIFAANNSENSEIRQGGWPGPTRPGI